MKFSYLLNFIPILLTFVSVVFFIFGLGKLFSEYQINKRVKQLTNQNQSTKKLVTASTTLSRNWTNLLRPLYQLSLPTDGWNATSSRLKFIRAGFRERTASSIYFAIKTLLFFGIPLLIIIPLVLLMPNKSLLSYGFYLLAAGAIGYYLPDIYLAYRTKNRAREMQESLPDLMDLLVICTEAGLGLDAALNRVSVEIRRTSLVLSEEFYLACLEIRAGASRMNALKNLALRVNLEDLHALVAMLVQADKFGTSLGDSLRIQSEFMRVKRMQRAEEIAAKIPTKMLIPLILFIFPVLLMVLLGPAVLQMGKVFAN